MFISYAQNFEDVLLWRALKDVGAGFYIDVGAQDPNIDSVSLAFYERGWRGVHIEPTPHYAEKLVAARRDEEVIQAAIARQAGTIEFFEMPDTGLSTGSKEIAERHQSDGFQVRRIEVPAIALSDILDRYADRTVHWLKIDVEGMEGEVIESWPPSSVRPWVVVIESTLPRSQESSHAGWEPQLLALGYEFAHFDGLNRFYVHESEGRLKNVLQLGPNFFDDFSLGGFSPYARKLNGDIADLNRQITEKATETAHYAATLEATRARADAELASFTQATQSWQTASAALSKELTAKDVALAAHEAERTQLQGHITELTSHVQAASQRETVLSERITELTSHVQAASQRETMLSQRITELTSHVQAASQRETALSQNITAMERSTSWRVSAPLRGLKIMTQAVIRFPRNKSRQLLDFALRRTAEKPRMRSLLKRAIHIVPPLERKVQAFAAARGHRPAPQEQALTAWMLEPDPKTLGEWEKLLNVPRKERRQ